MNARELRLSPAQLLVEQARQEEVRRKKLLRTAPKRREGKRAKAESRAEHVNRTAKLRVAVFVEYEGHCAACKMDLGNAWEFHHVEGAGLRRSHQRMGNVLPLCWDCHRRAHRGDLGTLAQIAQASTLDAEARKAVERKIAKVEEARAVRGERVAEGTRP
jgi:predicted restriction endonuclease